MVLNRAYRNRDFLIVLFNVFYSASGPITIFDSRCEQKDEARDVFFGGWGVGGAHIHTERDTERGGGGDTQTHRETYRDVRRVGGLVQGRHTYT